MLMTSRSLDATSPSLTVSIDSMADFGPPCATAGVGRGTARCRSDRRSGRVKKRSVGPASSDVARVIGDFHRDRR